MSNITQDELSSLIRRITELLDSSKIKYHLTGGIASSYYGDPRYTQDIDLVTNIGATDVDNLIQNLGVDYFYNPNAIREAVMSGNMFQLLDKETYIKVDLYPKQAIPDELSRSKKVELFENSHCNILSIEDAIVSKLRWAKLGSQRSVTDAIGMLESEHSKDFDLLKKIAKEVGVLDELEALIKT